MGIGKQDICTNEPSYSTIASLGRTVGGKEESIHPQAQLHAKSFLKAISNDVD